MLLLCDNSLLGSRDNSLLVPETTANSWWNCQMSPTSANCCQLIPQDRATVFPAICQLAAAELTHDSLKPLRLPYSSRLRLSLLLAGDVHPNPGPATQYPCAVCTSNVTSRGVSFKCNQCSGWVHSKCSSLKNAAQYRKTKDWACSSCNSPPAPSQLQAPPPPTLSTVNLWDKPVKSIRELSFLDPRNLD